VPLDAEGEPCRAPDRGGLDHPVGRACLDRQAVGKPRDRLAVQRVDFDPAAAQDRLELAARRDLDVMQRAVARIELGRFRRPVVEPPLAALDLALQRAAQRHVQLLKTAADAQQRHAALQHLADERQGGRIAVMVVGLVLRACLAAVMGRMDIGQRAGQHDAREMIERRIELRLAGGRQHNGGAAGDLGHGAHVFVADRMEHQAVELGGIGGKCHEGQVWPCHAVHVVNESAPLLTPQASPVTTPAPDPL
jgi:hypothetical protein